MNNDDLYSAMYGTSDDNEATREQPIQLRLAGKANVVNVNGTQVTIPKIDYVEILETRIVSLERLVIEQAATIKKMNMKMGQMNIALARKSDVKDKKF